MPQLSTLGRRVLAHLPPWVEDEAAYIAEEEKDSTEEAPVSSIRSYNLEDFTVRFNEDQSSPELTQEQALESLQPLVDAGYAEVDEDGQYKMTQAGFDALHAPRDDVEQIPGAVFVELNPATVDTSAEG